jgi:hypothetical protein
LNLVSPKDHHGVNSTQVTLTYNASDNFELTECRLYINGVYNQSNQTELINGLNNFSSDFEETAYNWSVICFDGGGNNASSANWTFYVDVTYPQIELHLPEPNANITNSTILFSYTPNDNYPNLTCTVYVDGEQNITTNVTSGIRRNVTGYGYDDGIHSWNVSCTDIGNNTNFSVTREFNLSEFPRIFQDAPKNNTHIKNSTINLYYTAYDNDGFEKCDLYINGEYNQSNETNVLSGVANNFSLIEPVEGYYN